MSCPRDSWMQHVACRVTKKIKEHVLASRNYSSEIYESFFIRCDYILQMTKQADRWSSDEFF